MDSIPIETNLQFKDDIHYLLSSSILDRVDGIGNLLMVYGWRAYRQVSIHPAKSITCLITIIAMIKCVFHYCVVLCRFVFSAHVRTYMVKSAGYVRHTFATRTNGPEIGVPCKYVHVVYQFIIKFKSSIVVFVYIAIESIVL